jgi:rSAM/selenodomain-associated transferase 1
VQTIAIGIFCKTPAPGLSKTRLSPPLRPDECAAISACFIRDLTATIAEVARDGGATGYAVYTPAGTESTLRTLLPPGFRLLPQCEGDFGVRLMTATRELLQTHAGAIMVNADSPTLPTGFLVEAARALQRPGDRVVLGPAEDGGYFLIGLKRPHRRLFEDIAWSTDRVFGQTLDRAAELGLETVILPRWYDVDDPESLRRLLDEVLGSGDPEGYAAPHTARILRDLFAEIGTTRLGRGPR